MPKRDYLYIKLWDDIELYVSRVTQSVYLRKRDDENKTVKDLCAVGYYKKDGKDHLNLTVGNMYMMWSEESGVNVSLA